MHRLRTPRERTAFGLPVLLLAALTLVKDVLAQPPGAVVAADKRVQARSYVFESTGQTLPYAVFVPSHYDAAKPTPLIVGLHGNGRPFDWLMGYDGIVDMAERDGFIMVTPLGYHPNGFFGNVNPLLLGDAAPSYLANGTGAATDPAVRARLDRARAEVAKLPPNIAELSEQDVMNVLALARKEFNVDPNRIYLLGHSMGGGGALYLAAKYPDVWAGVAAAAPYRPPNFAEQTERFRPIPTLVLQGDADRSIPVEVTREWVAEMKRLGMDVLYVEIPGGEHTPFVAKNRDTLSKVFSFFNIVRKDQRGKTSR
jgi:poly(3-hydroxybutyrate) depolymerase